MTKLILLVHYSCVFYLATSYVPVTRQAAITFRHYFTLVMLQVIPVLAHNENRTLYYRESKCFCRGPEILRRTNHCTRMSELGYDT